MWVQCKPGHRGTLYPPCELARSLCLFGAASARVDAVDAVFTNFRDPQGLRSESIDALPPMQSSFYPAIVLATSTGKQLSLTVALTRH